MSSKSNKIASEKLGKDIDRIIEYVDFEGDGMFTIK